MHSKKLSKQTMVISLVLLLGAAIVATFLMFIISQAESSNDILQYIVGFVAIISGISGVLLGFSSTKTTQLESVRTFFDKGDGPEYMRARKILYTYKKQLIKTDIDLYHDDFEMKFIDDCKDTSTLKKDDILKQISFIANFYQAWGLLVEKKFLPLWVFQGASGVGVCILYEIALPSIIRARKERNPFYAENFEWLYKRVKKVYAKELEKYYKVNKEFIK